MSEFLAEAQVRIAPDTSRFRAELEAELRAATRGLTVSIPVSAAAVAGPQLQQQTQAVQQAQAQLQALSTTQTATATATTRAAAASRGKTEAQKLEARAARLLAIADEEVLNVTTALAAAQVTATRSANALAAARRANRNLTAQDSAQTRQAVANTLALAEAQNAQAATALHQARANAGAASSMASLSRGAGSASAALLGVRGATLAANSTFLAGAVAVATLSKSLSAATDFASQMSVLGATTGASASEMERAAEAARALGRDITLPGVTAGSAAEAMTELSRAGLSVQDSIDGARGVLQLATAAQLSNADATELAASALNAFGLEGNQAVRVADLLANAANEAQGGIGEMGLALRQSAGVARQVGISLDDTVAILTLLARNGLQGSDAGTALRTSLIRLINPGKEARDVLRELNVELRDQQGNIRPEVFADFAEAQRGLTKAQQDANAAIVFGQDAIRALAILGREGETGLNQVTTALERQGTAARLAGARMTGLKGSTANLQNQLDTLSIEIGNLATKALVPAIDNLATFIGLMNTGVDVAKEFGDALGDIPGGDAFGGFLGDTVGTFFGDPTTFFAPITRLADEAGKVKPDLENAGAELRSSIEDMGREAAAGAVTFGDQVTRAITEAFNRVRATIQDANQRARSAALEAVRGSGGQAAGLEEQFSGIIAAGGSIQQQIANLRRQAEIQARIIEKAGPSAAGVLLEARRQARDRLASINSQIKGLEDQIKADQDRAAADARQRAEDIQRSRDEADQAFLDLVAGRLARADNRILAAEATAALADDIAANRVKREVLQAQIQEVRVTVQDAKKRRDELRDLTKDLIEVNNEIRDLTRQQREAEQERQREARERVTGDLAKRTQLAELRGDEQGQLRALNAQIADAKRRVAAAKKLKDGVLDEQIALQELINARRDLLKQISDANAEQQGTSILEFLSGNVDLFRQTASNIGTAGIDPLSGFDFSKSLVAGLTRLQEAARAQRPGAVTPPPRTIVNEARQADAIERLIAALDRNTDATAGNTTTGGTGLNAQARVALGQGPAALASFWEARRARQLQEDATNG